MTSCRQTVTSMSFFRFMADLQPSESRIPNSPLIDLTKTENIARKSLTQLSYYCFV